MEQDEPILQIPVSTMYNIVDNFQNAHLLGISDNSPLNSNLFAIQISNDFLPAFLLEQYDRNGMEENDAQKIINGQVDDDDNENLENMVGMYHNLEKALFGTQV